MFPSYAWVILWTGQCFLSPLSLSNQTNKWSTVSSVAVIHASRKKRILPAPNGFSCFCCSFSTSPCLYMWIHTPANTDVKGCRADYRLRRRVFIFITVLFVTAVLQLWSECAVHTDEESDPCMSLSWSYFVIFIFFLNFSGYFFWVLFWFASLRCFSKKKTKKN